MTISAPATHDAAETGLVETAGVEFAHRRFGPPTGVRLVLLQHRRRSHLFDPNSLEVDP